MLGRAMEAFLIEVHSQTRFAIFLQLLMMNARVFALVMHFASHELYGTLLLLCMSTQSRLRCFCFAVCCQHCIQIYTNRVCRTKTGWCGRLPPLVVCIVQSGLQHGGTTFLIFTESEVHGKRHYEIMICIILVFLTFGFVRPYLALS